MFALDPTFLSFPIPVFFSLPTKRLAVEWGESKGRDCQAVEEVGGGLFRTWRSMEELATRQGAE